MGEVDKESQRERAGDTARFLGSLGVKFLQHHSVGLAEAGLGIGWVDVTERQVSLQERADMVDQGPWIVQESFQFNMGHKGESRDLDKWEAGG